MDIDTVYKIGLDLHGVVDAHPVLFRGLAQKWMDAGQEVHIVTGQTWKEAEGVVSGLRIPYTHHFSVVDHHVERGTHVWQTETGPWMDGTIWDSTKGLYARSVGLHIHFDDTVRYAQHFPRSCSFVWVGKHFMDVYCEVLMTMLP